MITKTELMRQIVQTVRLVKETNPMVPSVTNAVTINFVANAQIAIGGSAAMTYLPDEVEHLVKAGGAFYINMGTMLPVYEQTIPRAVEVAREIHKRWVLDPVGISSGTRRADLLKTLKQNPPAIVRGNASEIIMVADMWGVVPCEDIQTARGVDSTQTPDQARDAAIALARFTGGAVAVSGVDDLVTDGMVVARSHGGSHFMAEITGSGCSLGGVCAVYAACAETPFVAALAGVNIYNLAGLRAEVLAKGPASFQTEFLDQLYLATPEEVATNPFEIEEA